MTRRTRTDYIVVHCSATRPALDIGVREIREWHIAKGWADCGYHVVIRRNGLIEFGRHPDEVGAHVAGFNTVSVGVCLVGGLYENGGEADDDFAGLFTEEQSHALADVLTVLEAAYPDASILGHRDLSPDLDKDGKVERHEWTKSCPGFSVENWCKLQGL